MSAWIRWWRASVCFFLLLCLGITQVQAADQVAYQDLPREAKTTISLIQKGGPFPYDKDGSVFGNYEKRLPKQSRGYYREYTVKTPYARNRGARRIITGGEGRGMQYFYTDDHYRSFRRVVDLR
ncbi:ribonuclease domain-containing protein [Undibacterium cyanobacteriorum]|uniref:Ribonuclease domain-containing protein n=1 Tax=Undibacterium cyanobacteriorum TaxID=3073561 RepID=A0ABY9REE7_9BURK|nr:ribonuclease domain-containing protein [Undibacterium sp. 20NA77.5]WMW79544.1 ribonuclease domain-containing protein [Undibacterium sp. 20NA77.5]